MFQPGTQHESADDRKWHAASASSERGLKWQSIIRSDLMLQHHWKEKVLQAQRRLDSYLIFESYLNEDWSVKCAKDQFQTFVNML